MTPDLFGAFLDGFVAVFAWPAFGLLLLGVGIGLAVGLLPGLGGPAALAIMLSFTFDMEPVSAFAFLLGMMSVLATTGDITSILFGVPGEATSAALVVDGHAMAKRGQAGRALGAALASSLMGALVGAIGLLALIPVVRPLVLSFGSPEFFMVTVLGITMVATLVRGAVVKGLIAALLGLLLATVGMDPHTGVQRFTFGSLYLWGGVSLVPVTVGLFAIPELYELAVRGTSIGRSLDRAGQVMEGVKDTFRYWWLTIRCSLLGAGIGILPGLGGSVAQWMAYAHAVQGLDGSDGRTRAGDGAIEGVIGPGAANNSKEGGSLIPLVAFGVPGSVTTAILLGAFLIQGIVPGPEMLTSQLPLTMSFVWLLVVANVITVGVSLLLVKPLSRLTHIRGDLLIPPIILMIFVGAFAEKNRIEDVLATIAFGLLGLLMMRTGYPRPPLILGLVLSGLAENFLFISTNRYGLNWLGRPIVLALIALTILSLLGGIRRNRRSRDAAADPTHAAPRRGDHHLGEARPAGEHLGRGGPVVDGGVSGLAVGARAERGAGVRAARGPAVSRARVELIALAVLLVITAVALYAARDWAYQARTFPALIVAALLVLGVLRVTLLRAEVQSGVEHDATSDGAAPSADQEFVVPEDAEARKRGRMLLLWITGFYLVMVTFGFSVGGTIAMGLYLRLEARERWLVVVMGAGLTALFFWVLESMLHVPLPNGWI